MACTVINFQIYNLGEINNHKNISVKDKLYDNDKIRLKSKIGSAWIGLYAIEDNQNKFPSI